MAKTFKFKDLMINVGQVESPGCLDYASIPLACKLTASRPIECTPVTTGRFCCHYACTYITPVPCFPYIETKLPCLGGLDSRLLEYASQDPEQLVALKEQLTRALAEVNKQVEANEESQRPQTVAEADELKTKLEGVLEELKARRAELVKKEKEPK